MLFTLPVAPGLVETLVTMFAVQLLLHADLYACNAASCRARESPQRNRIFAGYREVKVVSP